MFGDQGSLQEIVFLHFKFLNRAYQEISFEKPSVYLTFPDCSLITRNNNCFNFIITTTVEATKMISLLVADCSGFEKCSRITYCCWLRKTYIWKEKDMINIFSEFIVQLSLKNEVKSSVCFIYLPSYFARTCCHGK